MNYIITNPNKKVYIRLSKNGSPITCTRPQAQHFDKEKAQNIVKCLPKTFKKFHFCIEAVQEEIVDNEIIHKADEVKEVIVNANYTVPEVVVQWIDKVKTCNNLAKDAVKRKAELVQALSNIEKDLSNCLHIIELTKWKNGCDGYKEYKAVKTVLERRRIVKDELSVVDSILTSNLESIATNRIEEVVERLSNRQFNVREVENYENL